MSELLISVRNASEAALVSQNPSVAIVDIKEPRYGSLGRANSETCNAIMNRVGRDTCLSLALGELSELRSGNQWEEFEAGIHQLQRFQFAKIGLANMRSVPDWRREWRRQLDLIPSGVGRVGVAYVDKRTSGAPSIDDVIEAGAEASCDVVLLDTFDKSSGNIFDHVSAARLQHILTSIRQQGMASVVAGSIDPDCLENVIRCRPDLIGIRGAVCTGNRRSSIDENKLDSFVNRYDSLQERFRLPPIGGDNKKQESIFQNRPLP